MIRFRHILGECDSKEWISEKLHDEETGVFYWMLVSILNMEGITGDALFVSTVSVVIPEIAGDRWKEAFGGFESEDEAERAANIWEYGNRADLWRTTCENPMEAMLEAVKAAQDVPSNFDELMSRPKNLLGWDGWKTCSSY